MGIRVIHIVSSGGYSGAEKMVCQMIEMFRQNQYYEMMYCGVNGVIQEICKIKNIYFVELDSFSIPEVHKMINMYRPDVIHTHDLRAGVYCALTANKGINIISHLHGGANNLNRFNVKSIFYRFCGYRFQNIICVSKALQAMFQYSRLYDKTLVLNNMIDCTELKRKVLEDNKNYDYDIIYLGRLTHIKNMIRLMDILEIVCKKIPDIKIAVIGDGNMRKETEYKAYSLNIEKNIDFLGWMDNPYKILKESNIMVMCSNNEGMPMSILEAMELGIPIVCTPVGGIKELVMDGETGYMEEEDVLLSERLVQLLNDKRLRKRFSENAMIRSKELNDMEYYKQILTQCYESGV